MEQFIMSALSSITVSGTTLAMFYIMWKKQIQMAELANKALLDAWRESTTKHLEEQQREFDRLWNQHDRAIEALEIHAAQMIRVNDRLELISKTLESHHNQTVGGHK